MERDLLTSTEAAGFLGVTRQRVDQLGSAGVIPRERMGSFWVYRKPDLVRWQAEANHRVGRPKDEATQITGNRTPALAAG